MAGNLIPKTVINEGILSNPGPPMKFFDLKTSYIESIFENIRKRIEEFGEDDVIVNADLGKKTDVQYVMLYKQRYVA